VSETEPASRRLWTDGFYLRIGWPTPLPGVVLSAALLLSLVALASGTDGFGRLEAEGLAWWQSRDARIGALLALLAGVVPTALRYHELGTRADLERLARAALWGEAPPDALRRATTGSPRAAVAFGLTGIFLVPTIAFLIDREVDLYFTTGYWGATQGWTWGVGFFVTFTGGILTYRAYSDARVFAALARSLPEIDLLERDALLPFARQGLRSAVPGVIFVTFLALNLMDEGFLLSAVLLGGLVAVQNVATLMLPLRGLHDRLREAKRRELSRVNAAIRGDAAALAGSPLSGGDITLTDLLTWRRFVESVPEWPVDLSTLGRFAFYIGIPLLSWVGAALVERALDRVIG
jgi:hypothetical protein